MAPLQEGILLAAPAADSPATAPRRVVWVTPSAPDHEGGGDQQRQAYLLDAVGGALETVVVVPQDVTDPAVLAKVATVTRVPRRPVPTLETWPARKLRLLRHHVLERDPWHVALAAPQRRALGRALDGTLRDGDVVVVEHLQLAPLLPPSPRPGRWLLTVHLSHSRQAAHHAAIAPTTRNRRFWATQVRRAHRLERWASTNYDAVVAVSQLDATAAATDIVVPNGVDLDRYVPTPLPDNRRVVVTGSLDTGPNADGVTWFVDEVWPAVVANVPDATLTVVGRRPRPEVHELDGRPGIQLCPDVPEIDPYLAGARVAAVPLRLGGGTRLKALQAMAAGRPVVGTGIGLEGLDLVDGVHALIADSPRDLAAAVARVLTDDALAEKLGRSGREHVEAHHGWRAIAQAFLHDVVCR